MLEQPPERNLLEIQAEAARAAKRQIKPVNRGIRTLIWAIPFACTFLIFINGYLITLRIPITTSLENRLLIVVPIIVSFGVGIFDAFLSRAVREAMGNKKTLKIITHTIIFMLAQLILIPSMAVMLLGIYKAIYNW